MLCDGLREVSWSGNLPLHQLLRQLLLFIRLQRAFKQILYNSDDTLSEDD